ncbi:hypothetical protein Clacol_000132 [Clathrus columnatus]|uniref:AAA+ ATPase domain-containing protein n=1 Tax=Clathrus columnatus TaxID=1419009 RepID=A0AAV4ZZ29_9AGAM|nr:hypothetical protein Clacol_000132 [Clathrus columnatus]
MAVSPQTTTIFDDFLPSYHSPPLSFPGYTITSQVKAQYPNHQHIVLNTEIPLLDYLQSHNIEYQTADQLTTHSFVSNDLIPNIQIGLFEFEWRETSFLLYKFVWPSSQMMRGQNPLAYVLVFLGKGDSRKEKDAIGFDLLTTAFRWNLDTKDEIWVFSNGHWSKDKKLYKAIASSSWDNLVLDQGFINGLKRDTETFFSSKDIYHSLGITWKRGLLLLGAPGNGKTESIKVLLKETNVPALYVKSFTTNSGEEAGIRTIFEFARRQALCILVLEDLDSLVVPRIRAFFLNELDGLEQNEGILTIATSNHPEKIDDAILNRPSRFDVKYTFDLPSKELRLAYIQAWTEKAKGLQDITFSRTFMEEIAEETNGFSFAFMKELCVKFTINKYILFMEYVYRFVSFLLRLAHDKAAQRTIDVEASMKNQVKELKTQIDIGKNTPENEEPRRGATIIRHVQATPVLSGPSGSW